MTGRQSTAATLDTMSILTVQDLLARSCVDRQTNCWHWLGAKSAGTPRIWTFDHERNEKRCMSGPKAVWNIAHGEAPLRGHWVMRSCLCTDCVAPVHHKQVASRGEMGLHIRRSGSRKGKNLDACRANILKAHAVNGIVPTPASVVSAILKAGVNQTNSSLAKQFGIAHQTVSNIRLGKTRANAMRDSDLTSHQHRAPR